MSFVYPVFLYALAVLIIPILIHLFNFRRFRKLYFSNIRFLKDVELETRTQSRLKHLLVLTSRLLALAFLVIAFAQPYIPAGNQQGAVGPKQVSIYIDNSFSMELTGETGDLLQEARSKASELIKSYGPGDRFRIITNDLKASGQQFVTATEAIEQIDQVDVSSSSQMLSDMALRMNDALSSNEGENKVAYVLGDFQESTNDLESTPFDTTIQYHLLQIPSQITNNLSIDSCWFESPIRLAGRSEELNVVVTNHNEEPVENVPLTLFINEQQAVPSTVSLGPNESQTVSLKYTNHVKGFVKGMLEIQDHPVGFDDKFYFSYEINPVRKVLVLSGEQSEQNPIKSLFGEDEDFVLTMQQAAQADVSTFKQNSVICLYHVKKVSSGLVAQLNAFCESGGSVMVIPHTDADIDSYNELLAALDLGQMSKPDTGTSRVNLINYDHYLFDNVFESKPENLDLPIANKYYPISVKQYKLGDHVMTMQNGYPFVLQSKVGRGNSYALAVSLDETYSNFQNHAIIVPTLYNVALYSIPEEPYYHIIGSKSVIELQGQQQQDEIYHIRSGELDFIPQIQLLKNTTRIFPGSSVAKDGYYDLLNNELQKTHQLAFNYNRSESQLIPHNNEALESFIERSGKNNIKLIEPEIKNLAGFVQDEASGRKYWRLCLIICLAFLALETLLIKLWKT